MDSAGDRITMLAFIVAGGIVSVAIWVIIVAAVCASLYCLPSYGRCDSSVGDSSAVAIVCVAAIKFLVLNV
jgi:hypothetical protein